MSSFFQFCRRNLKKHLVDVNNRIHTSKVKILAIFLLFDAGAVDTSEGVISVVCVVDTIAAVEAVECVAYVTSTAVAVSNLIVNNEVVAVHVRVECCEIQNLLAGAR